MSAHSGARVLASGRDGISNAARGRESAYYGEGSLISRRALYARDRFSPSCIKIILDGVPTDSHTAAMFHENLPTHAHDDPGRTRDMLMIEQAKLNEIVTRFDRMGMT